MLPPMNELLQRLGRRLGDGSQALPGAAAQDQMAPAPRRAPASRSPLAQAAVLVLFYPLGGRAHFVLTQRTATVTHHRLQVSLPGGRLEGQETPAEAALRETHEELAVNPASVTIVGSLSPLAVSVSGFVIHPVVGSTGRRPDFTADPREVARIIEVSLETLADPCSVKHEAWSVDGIDRVVPFFEIDGHKVWGATAMILSELLALIDDLSGDTAGRDRRP